MTRGSGSSGMDRPERAGQVGFYGRKDEVSRFMEELRDPRGAAIVVVGQQGMGKTWLLDKFGEIARAMTDVRCGVVREEVTRTQTVDSVLALLMDQVYDAGQVTEDSLAPTAKRRQQWQALLNVLNIGDLVMSLRRDPAQNTREQFLAAMERVSAKMSEDMRAVFLIDPEKYLHEGSDEDWTIVTRRLPEKIKLVFAQRPDDAIADSHAFAGLSNVRQIPAGFLEELDSTGYEELVREAAQFLQMGQIELHGVLDRYDRHPYAIGAAFGLIADGTSLDQLPENPEPTRFAEEQWKRIRRAGERAIQLFQAHAVLKVEVLSEIVEQVSDLTEAQRLHVESDAYLGTLLREENGLSRIYHSTLSDYIGGSLAKDQWTRLNKRAIAAYWHRLKSVPPDIQAARHISTHVLEAEGVDAAANCLMSACLNPLIVRGMYSEALALVNKYLEWSTTAISD